MSLTYDLCSGNNEAIASVTRRPILLTVGDFVEIEVVPLSL